MFAFIINYSTLASLNEHVACCCCAFMGLVTVNMQGKGHVDVSLDAHKQEA